MKSIAGREILGWGSVCAGVHVEIEHLFPHRIQKTKMTLLAGIFLGDLQFDGFVCFLECAEQRRYWFARLEIDGTVFDLDDYVVIELAVERMEVVGGRFGAIILGVPPIEMMVVDKGAIENDAAVRSERASDHIGGVRRRAMVGRGTQATFGVRFHDETPKVGDEAINFVRFL